MTVRLFSLVAAALFSFSVYANKMAPPDKSAEIMKQLVACGEVKAAKHIALMIPMAIAAAFSKSMAEDLAPYENKLAQVKSCGDFDVAYNILVEVAKNNGTDVDAYFASAEGKQTLEDLIIELRKLK
jgi:hypothetical protein